MSENAIITAASVIGAGLVCLGAAAGAGADPPRRHGYAGRYADPAARRYRKKLVKSLPTCWFA